MKLIKSLSKNTNKFSKATYIGQETIAPLKMASIGQGTIEYLVILAVIVVIGLTLVTISANFLDTANQTTVSSKNLVGTAQSNIVVREAVIDYEGDSLLFIQNNTGEEIFLTKISLDGREDNYNELINPSSEKIFSFSNLNTNCSCTPGEQTKICNYDLYYTSIYGLEKKETLEIKLECVANAQSNRPVITPQVPADTQAPQIISFSPENNFESENLTVTFNYEATDNNQIQSCALYVNNELVDTNNNSEGTLTHTFNEDILTNWHITCTDHANNTTQTQTRNININHTPYQITTCTELQEITEDLTGDYTLQNNIDCSDTINWNSGAGFEPIGDFSNMFSGSLSGNKKIINNLTINRPGQTTIGLFGRTNMTGGIKELGLTDVNIIGLNFVGAITGWNANGTISEVFSTGTIIGERSVGGITGAIQGGLVTNSYSINNINASIEIGGGIAGQRGNILNSYYAGLITGPNIGGISAVNGYGGIVTNSYWDTDMSSIENSAGGTSKTTLQMVYDYNDEDTFSAWDFDDVWAHDIDGTINNGYPYLKWQTE